MADDGRDPAAVALETVNGFAASLDAAQVRALRAGARIAS